MLEHGGEARGEDAPISNSGILHGVRVVDLTRSMSGAIATMLLADAGADVVMIEDPVRRRCESAGYITWNRGKFSVAANPMVAADRDLVSALLTSADVVVLGSPDLHDAGWDLRLDELRLANPSLIVARLRSYPAGTEKADRLVTDIIIQADSGLMDETPGRRHGPLFLRFPAPSWGAAGLLACGIVVSLLRRVRCGRADGVDTSLVQGALYFMSNIWSLAEHPTPSLFAKSGAPNRPHPWIFRCADGQWIHTHVRFVDCPPTIESLVDMGEEPPDFETQALDEVMPLFRRMFSRRSARDWMDLLRAHDVDCTLLGSLHEALTDVDLVADGHTVMVDDPSRGHCRQAAGPARVCPPARARWGAPALGAHTSQIRTLGWPGPRLTQQPGALPDDRPMLDGIRVLDLGMNVSGPGCAKLFAELGASVIKVEPLSGDRLRPEELLFLGANRGKRSIAVALDTSDGQRVLKRLVAASDVVVHNLRPAKAQRLGIDYESLQAINPAIVYNQVHGYAFDGARAELPARDYVVGARSGFSLAGGSDSQGPTWLRILTGDSGTALFSFFGTLLALYRRERDGFGSVVSTSMLGTAALYASETYVNADGQVVCDGLRVDDAITGLNPAYRIYEAADGWVAVGATEADAPDRLRRAFGLPLDGDLDKAMHKLRAAEVLERLEHAELPSVAVNRSYEQPFMEDPVNRAIGLATSVTHPIFGELRQPGRFWQFHDETLPELLAPPLVGQHSEQILEDLGFTREEIAAMFAAASVGTTLPHTS